MGILQLLNKKQKKKWVTEFDFSINRAKQSHLAIEKLVRLRDLNVEEEDKFKIEFCFYATGIEKAQELTKALQQLHYTVDNGIPGSRNKFFTVSGTSNAMKMEYDVLRKWAEEMCDLGYAFDSNFEYWEVMV